MEISARNQIRGRVKSLRVGDIMGEVEVAIEPSTIVAAITSASIGRLGLREDDEVTVIVKSTEVLIGK